MPMLDETEKNRILFDWNVTDVDYSETMTLHRLFEIQVEKTPHNIAAIFKHRQLTYQELNERANQLAHHLRDHGLKAGDLVAININKNIEMVIALLGVLKAGGAYVPLETDWPFAHRKNILLSLDIVYLLTDNQQLKIAQNLQWSLPELNHVICLDIIDSKPGVEEEDWSKVKLEWDYLTEIADDPMSANFINSYTGLPFSMEEVKEYKDHIVNLVLPYAKKGSSVLEIGCGSGLIMFELASHVKHFVGLDPSSTAQKSNQRYIAKNGIKNIELVEGFAHDISQLEQEELDLILLASTIQFFPGYQYVEKIIESALSLLKPDGVLIIADIMDLAQRDVFINSLEHFRKENPHYRTRKVVDRELYFDENYFIDLKCDFSQITDLKILRRNGFNNELSYRYDIVIQKNEKQVAPANQANQVTRHKSLWTYWHVSQYSQSNVSECLVDPMSIAYIIHTSGSTGKPKGVVIQHKPVINLIEWVNNTFHVNESDRVLAVASICFDLSVYDIFGLLAAGGSILLPSKEELQDPEVIAKLLINETITFWNSAPPVLNQIAYLLETNHLACMSEKLRLIFLSGDWIPLNLPDRLKKYFPRAEIISLGGATEATVWSNYYPISIIDSNWKSIPYGKPIQNAKYYILDEYLNPCPVGVVGDLYIGGECLALGYKNASEEDNSRFLDNPFRSDKDKALGRNLRLYRTGDLASYFSDGNIEFLGRKDYQVKIRGFRVECGEIETVLQKHPAVRDVVVTVKDTTEGKQLVAYIVPK